MLLCDFEKLVWLLDHVLLEAEPKRLP